MNEINVIHEDDHILVLNKPAGLVVNRAESQVEDTLEDWLHKEKGIVAERAGIVHRLDKDTSGVLLIAKSDAVKAALQEQFASRTTEKTYLALCHGWVSELAGVVSLALERNPFNRHKFHVAEQGSGRSAETTWQVQQYYQLPLSKIDQLLPNLNKNQKRYYALHATPFTLLELHPKTGRTHQIRVHLEALRHPIVSDTVYTSRKLLRLDLTWCPRQFLHAKELKITHPVTAKRMIFAAELPEDLRQALTTLEEMQKSKGKNQNLN